MCLFDYVMCTGAGGLLHIDIDILVTLTLLVTDILMPLTLLVTLRF